MIIKAKINVLKVDKSRLFEGKNGAKYLDVTLLENKDGVDQYGNDGMVIQDVTKEEREKGVRGAILGNFKIINQRHADKPASQKAAATAPTEADEVPF